MAKMPRYFALHNQLKWLRKHAPSTGWCARLSRTKLNCPEKEKRKRKNKRENENTTQYLYFVFTLCERLMCEKQQQQRRLVGEPLPMQQHMITDYTLYYMFWLATISTIFVFRQGLQIQRHHRWQIENRFNIFIRWVTPFAEWLQTYLLCRCERQLHALCSVQRTAQCGWKWFTLSYIVRKFPIVG